MLSFSQWKATTDTLSLNRKVEEPMYADRRCHWMELQDVKFSPGVGH